jgi:hypothetical protein
MLRHIHLWQLLRLFTRKERQQLGKQHLQQHHQQQLDQQ